MQYSMICVLSEDETNIMNEGLYDEAVDVVMEGIESTLSPFGRWR